MTEGNGNSGSDRFEALRRYVPLVSWAIVFILLLIIPLKVISYGFLPADDALRHAAKAVCGKPWRDILVLGPTFHFDPNWGWHWFLRQFHLALNWDAGQLVVFEIVMLFVVGNWAIAACMKRPEAWLMALIIASLAFGMIQRLLLGRPFVLSIMAIGLVLLVSQRNGPSSPKWQNILWMTPLIALAIFLHGVWYLWVLPIASFFFARQFRWCFLLAASWVLGTFLGSAFTGHPIESIAQAIELAFHALGMHPTPKTLVSELQPSGGDIFTLMTLGALVVLRHVTRLNAPSLLRHPAFWLAVLGWVLGCGTYRFWSDWGAPALMVLVATDLQYFFQARFAADSFQRLTLVFILAVSCYAVTTNDVNDRWTNNLTWQYLTPDNPDVKGWLPGKGGILYSSDMEVFFQTFFKNPNADWRYALGFESTLMTDDNFKTYYDILWNFGDAKAYQPWVDKMRPQDRLVIRGNRSAPPNIPQLEWNYAVTGSWVGRLPQPVEKGTAPPMIYATEPITNSISATIVSPDGNQTNSVPAKNSAK